MEPPPEWVGCVSAIESNGRTIWIADAHRDDGKRFVVHADEKLTTFVELEAVVRGRGFCIDKLAGFLLSFAPLKSLNSA
jgi:hypothetical protein